MTDDPPVDPARVPAEGLEQRARDWVLKHKTSDGCGLHDSWFMIHAETAIDWMAQFASNELLAARSGSVPLPPEVHCLFCGYGEYVVNGDWVRAWQRRTAHEAQCHRNPANAVTSPARGGETAP